MKRNRSASCFALEIGHMAIEIVKERGGNELGDWGEEDLVGESVVLMGKGSDFE